MKKCNFHNWNERNGRVDQTALTVITPMMMSATFERTIVTASKHRFALVNLKVRSYIHLKDHAHDGGRIVGRDFEGLLTIAVRTHEDVCRRLWTTAMSA